MRQRDVGVVGVGALLALALLGGVVSETSAQHAGGEVSQRAIRVMGTGEVRVMPDQARISFAVETFAESADAAGADNARRMDRVIAALVRAGVPREDMETQRYSVYPEYIHDREGAEPRIRGYRATNQMVLTTTELERVGELIDVALGAGANRMEGVGFSLQDADAASARALTQAVERARATAQTIAAALGVRLGPVIEASTSTAPSPPMYRMEAAPMADARTTTPITPGEQTVQATVSLAFAIEG